MVTLPNNRTMTHYLRPALLALLFSLLPGTGARAQQTPPATFPAPLNDIVSDRAAVRAPALTPKAPRAADLAWEKRVWRVIDVREKLNHPFAYPPRPLVSILLEAAEQQKIQLYSPVDDRFSTPLTADERLAISGWPDTVPVFNDFDEVTYEVVPREFDPARVTRYRVQEVWYFDRQTSTRQVRILGIAPIVDEADEGADFSYERVLFWAYFPAARAVLGEEQAYVAGNDAGNRNWADVFDARLFNSYITKESNVYDRRVEDYLPAGRDRLLEGRRIEAGLLDREQDGWSW